MDINKELIVVREGQELYEGKETGRIIFHAQLDQSGYYNFLGRGETKALAIADLLRRIESEKKGEPR